MSTAKPSRFRLLGVVGISALIYFCITRLCLLFLTLSHGDDAFGLEDLLTLWSIGLLYDLAFYAYAAIPVCLYLWLAPNRLWCSRINTVLVKLAIFATLYGLGFIALSEWFFWQEFNVRFNFIAVDYLVYRREVMSNINESYAVGPLLIGLFFITLAIFSLLSRWLDQPLRASESFLRRTALALVVLLPAALAFAMLDQSPRDALRPFVRELGSNGPYQFIAAFRNNELDYASFYATEPDAKAATLLRASVAEPAAVSFARPDEPYSLLRWVRPASPPRELNVVLVMLESFSARFLDTYGSEKHLTPNLDRLAKQSLNFSQMYATGTRTTRGLEAVTLSIPPTPGRSIVKRIGRESGLWSLGNVLSSQGYDARFFYGGRGYFDNMNAFFAGNGYRIVDQASTPSEQIGFENAWGMADEYLYQQVMRKADAAHSLGEKFFFQVMTTSNHRPYTYPEDRVDIPSGTGRDGAVAYTDWAIGDFMDKARQKPWFDDTVFVFIADHTAGAAGREELPLWRYHIPAMIYSPANIKPRTVATVASQIDIASTLLALLGQPYYSDSFGRDILTMPKEEGRALIATYQRLGYYTPGRLTVLEPGKAARQFLSPEGDAPQETQVLLQSHVDQAISYYQGASVIYTDGLNRWQPQPQPQPLPEGGLADVSSPFSLTQKAL